VQILIGFSHCYFLLFEDEVSSHSESKRCNKVPSTESFALGANPNWFSHCCFLLFEEGSTHFKSKRCKDVKRYQVLSATRSYQERLSRHKLAYLYFIVSTDDELHVHVPDRQVSVYRSLAAYHGPALSYIYITSDDMLPVSVTWGMKSTDSMLSAS
jgi:hypothetical protein